MKRSLAKDSTPDARNSESYVVTLAKVGHQNGFRYTPNDSDLCAVCDSVVRNLFIRMHGWLNTWIKDSLLDLMRQKTYPVRNRSEGN
jgi:hypothetical protein